MFGRIGEVFHTVIEKLTGKEESEAVIDESKGKLNEHKEKVETAQEHEAVQAFADYLEHVIPDEEKGTLFQNTGEAEGMESFVENYLGYTQAGKMLTVRGSWLLGLGDSKSTKALQKFGNEYFKAKKNGSEAMVKLVNQYVGQLPDSERTDYIYYAQKQEQENKNQAKGKAMDEANLTTGGIPIATLDANGNPIESRTNDQEVIRLSRARKAIAIAQSFVDKNISYSNNRKQDPEKGIDCSWLMHIAISRAGFLSPGHYSAIQAKKSMNRQIGVVNTQNDVLSLGDRIKPGMLLFWKCVDPKSKYYYNHSTTLPGIHHVAMVAEPAVTSDGRINIIESNGSNGCVKRSIRPEEASYSKKKKSELRVHDFDYVPTV